MELLIQWGADVLTSKTLRSGRAFTLGEANGDFPFPSSVLGSARWHLLTISGGTTRITAPDGTELGPLEVGGRAVFRVGEFTVCISGCELGTPPRGTGLGSVGGGALAAICLLCLFAAYLVPPLQDSEPPGHERGIVLRPMAVLMAGAVPDSEPPTLALADEPSGVAIRVPGHARCGEEDEPGHPLASAHGQYGLAGPKDNPDPHVARLARSPELALATGGPPALPAADVDTPAGASGDPHAPLMPWGREESLGVDDRSARGELIGDEIADAEGIVGVARVNLEGGLAKALVIEPAKATDRDDAPRLVHTGLRVDGPLAPTALHALMAPRFAALRGCYHAALEGSPKLAGRADLWLTWTTEGSAAVDVRGPLVDGSGLAACWRSALDGLALARPPARVVNAVYPLYMSPGAGAPSYATRERPTRTTKLTRSPCSSGVRSAKGGTRRGAAARPCRR